MEATQDQYNVLRQPTRRLFVKIDLLNDKEVIIDSLQGIAIGGNISVDATSTHRRSGSLTLLFDEKDRLLPAPDSRIWFDKRCQIYVGILNYMDEKIWFNMGRFVIDEVNIAFDPAGKTLSCQLKDYMSFLDGSLGGRLSHQTQIKANSVTINEAIRTSVASLTRVSIEDIELDGSLLLVPYDIEHGAGGSVYDILKELVELYMDYDFYFDENGYFIVEKIKNKIGDPVREIFDGLDHDFTLNSNLRIDLKNVANTIQVWGKQFLDGTMIHYKTTNKWVRETSTDLENLTEKEKGDICFILSTQQSFLWDGENWELLLFNIMPEFSVEKLGTKNQVYTEDRIFTESQAKIRSFYELKQYNNFAETINFSVVPLYNLQVNQKIKILEPDSAKGDYIITRINVPLEVNSAMTIEAYKLYY